MTSTLKPEKALSNLQQLIRRGSAPDVQMAIRKPLPADLQTDPPLEIRLDAEQAEAVKAAVASLVADPRFEHLRHVEDEVWRFVTESALDARDHLRAFVENHRKNPIDAICYFPVEFLTVDKELEVLGIRLLPTGDLRIPASKPRPAFNLDDPVGCVAAVNVYGTNYGRMADRAKTEAEHALRVLRLGLREYNGINNEQLRFQLATGYAFDAQLIGWRQRDDIAYHLSLDVDDLNVALSRPVAGLPTQPRNDVERKALLALRWLDKAFLTGDELEALLYRFFALEALLGDKSEGLKAHALAFREMMLSHLTRGRFRHPSVTWFLYEKVRSGAVHGSEVPELDWQTRARLESAVRDVLNQYLELAAREDITKRSKLLRLLDEHPERAVTIKWLRQNAGPGWGKYLDRLEWPESGC